MTKLSDNPQDYPWFRHRMKGFGSRYGVSSFLLAMRFCRSFSSDHLSSSATRWFAVFRLLFLLFFFFFFPLRLSFLGARLCVPFSTGCASIAICWLYVRFSCTYSILYIIVTSVPDCCGGYLPSKPVKRSSGVVLRDFVPR